MEKFEVIIIGAGIAGSGLAFNLKKNGFVGSVLIIDKEDLNNDRSSYRNTPTYTAEEYDLVRVKRFKGLKLGTYNQVYFSVDFEFSYIDYKKSCQKLIKKSLCPFKNEKAIKLENNILFTDKNVYRFNYLIDCSGSSFFIKKFFNKSIPFKFWLGKIKVFNEKIEFDKNYFYHMFSNYGYLEDFYVFDNKVIQGDWQYTSKVDFNLIKPHKKRIYDEQKEKLNNLKEEYNVVIPCSPVFPIVSDNIAFLGDSFGNATPSSAEGVRPILDSSKILANAIIENNLQNYEIVWKERYLKSYMDYLVSRMDLNRNSWISRFFKYPPYSKFLKLLGKDKENVLKRLLNQPAELSPEVKRSLPIISVFFRQLILRLYIKMKYSMMEKE